MDIPTSKDPLDGKTLEMLLNELVAEYGWEELGSLIKIKCFNDKPSIKSSLIFLLLYCGQSAVLLRGHVILKP